MTPYYSLRKIGALWCVLNMQGKTIFSSLSKGYAQQFILDNEEQEDCKDA